MTHLKRQKLISLTQVRGYNTQLLIISTAPKLIKFIFAVLDLSLTMDLTRCYKTQGFFTFTFAVFVHISRYFYQIHSFKKAESICILNFDEIPQSTAKIKLLPVSDDGWPPYWNFTSNFHFDLLCNYPHVMLHPPAKFRRKRTNIGGLLTSYRFFKMVVIESEIYF